MAKLYVSGTVEEIEDGKYLNIVVREDEENVFRLGANSKNRDGVKASVSMGDFVIINGIARSKKKENGFFNMDGWIHTIHNLTAEMKANIGLANAVKADKKKTEAEQKEEDKDPAPWD